jgi:hypothetical protein
MTTIKMMVNTRNYENGVKQAVSKVAKIFETGFIPNKSGEMNSELTLRFKSKIDALDAYDIFQDLYKGEIINPLMSTGATVYALYKSDRLLPAIV